MKVKQNPFGLHTATPYLIVDDVATLIEFLKQVFDTELRGNPQYRDDGTVKHAEVKIGDSVIMMGEPTRDFGPMPATIYLYVDDCDTRYKKALEAGAIPMIKPENYPHGDRYGGVKDPVGNIWWVVTHIGKPTKDA